MTLASALKPGPLAGSDGAAKLNELLSAHPELKVLTQKNSPVADVLSGIAEGSSFLWQLALADPARLIMLLDRQPDAARAQILSDIRADVADEADLMRRLRKAKQEMALLLGLADVGGVWDVPTITAALSDLADSSISAALRFLLRGEIASGKFKGDPGDPEKGSGLVVLAMGKHGARELNYSSDIDLIVFYERAVAPLE